MLTACAGATLHQEQAPDIGGAGTSDPGPLAGTGSGDVGSGAAEIASGVEVIADLPASPAVAARPRLAWSPDGRKLMYIGASQVEAQPWGRVMAVDLTRPGEPQPVTDRPAFNAVWRPDGRAVAFVGTRGEPPNHVETVFLQPLEGGAPVDLLPGDLAVRGVSTSKYLHRWVNGDLLAYQEHRGTGTSELLLLDPDRRELVSTPELLASNYDWSQAGNGLAGQWSGGLARFWVWDRRTARWLLPDEPVSGAYRWFESWTPDGDTALFTVWTTPPPYTLPGGDPELFRWDAGSGAAHKLADNAGLAAMAGDYVVYVRFGIQMELVVARSPGTEILWTAGLGALPADEHGDGIWWWEYRPVLFGPWVAYHRSDGLWVVSPIERGEPRPLFTGKRVEISPSPDGRYLGLLESKVPARLRIVRNPLRS